ncbi:MAG: hypothetical protein SOW59_08480 [Corynebacterium sp.]|nr:hypothetical protein [Corynebacterium sp.]
MAARLKALVLALAMATVVLGSPAALPNAHAETSVMVVAKDGEAGLVSKIWGAGLKASAAVITPIAPMTGAVVAATGSVMERDGAGAVAEAAKSAFWNSTIGKMTEAFLEGHTQLFQAVLTLWMTFDFDPRVGEENITGVRNIVVLLSAAALMISLIVGGIRLAVNQRQGLDDGLADIGAVLVRMAVASSLVPVITISGMTLADSLANEIMTQFGPSDIELLVHLADGMGFEVVFGPVLILVIVVVSMLGSAMQFVALAVRFLIVPIAAGLAPLFAAGSGTSTGKAGLSHLYGYLAAAIVFKPVAALLYVMVWWWSTGLIGSDTTEITNEADGVAKLLVFVMLGVVGYSAPSLVKLVSPVAAPAAGGSGSAAGGALSAAAGMATGAISVAAGAMTGGASAAAGIAGKAATGAASAASAAGGSAAAGAGSGAHSAASGAGKNAVGRAGISRGGSDATAESAQPSGSNSMPDTSMGSDLEAGTTGASGTAASGVGQPEAGAGTSAQGSQGSVGGGADFGNSFAGDTTPPASAPGAGSAPADFSGAEQPSAPSPDAASSPATSASTTAAQGDNDGASGQRPGAGGQSGQGSSSAMPVPSSNSVQPAPVQTPAQDASSPVSPAGGSSSASHPSTKPMAAQSGQAAPIGGGGMGSSSSSSGGGGVTVRSLPQPGVASSGAGNHGVGGAVSSGGGSLGMRPRPVGTRGGGIRRGVRGAAGAAKAGAKAANYVGTAAQKIGGVLEVEAQAPTYFGQIHR